MENVKSVFSIKDLENISGIKAHTIRIWEKRYNILEPMRTDSNIRMYDITSLQKLLNITLLHNHGYKISRISSMQQEQIPDLVREIITEKSVRHHALSTFKMAMMNFDQTLFVNTYDTLLAEKSFREVFYEVIIPFMEDLGLLWQTNTITPAHEHFVSYLIKQKLLIATEKVQKEQPTRSDKTFVLYLPMNEVHELGLMYLNYELLFHGYRTLYLGESVPMDNLTEVNKFFDHLVYVSYFTVRPEPEDIDDYLTQFKNTILKDDAQLWVLGRNTHHLQDKKLPEGILSFPGIAQLIAHL